MCGVSGWLLKAAEIFSFFTEKELINHCSAVFHRSVNRTYSILQVLFYNAFCWSDCIKVLKVVCYLRGQGVLLSRVGFKACP